MEQSTANKKPNIVLINCDDLGYGDLGCYGSTVNNTPAIDNLAKEGIRFTDFYMASPLCSPSRGAMLTGCYPPRIEFGAFEQMGVLFPGQGLGLNPDEVTIAKLLQGQGYATKIVGKWHCGDQPEFLPTRHGFDSYYGLPYSNDMGRQSKRPSDEHELFPPLPLMADEEVIQQQPDQKALTERYVEQAVRFIRQNREQPFFLYFAHMHVHLPLYPAERFLKQAKNGRYGACVEAIDWATAVIMHELHKYSMDDNTLVIFTSDNGSRVRGEGGSNAPLHGTKATTWEGGLRVPCIMRWLCQIPAGTTCNELVTAMDFYSTLAKLGNARVPTDRIIDGKDISHLMYSGGKGESPHEVFFYYLMNRLEGVRKGDWKLTVYRWDRPVKELYNLKNDIGEINNVYDKHPGIVKELEAALEKCRQDIGDEVQGVRGENIRPIGRVDNPESLTKYDPNHPYIVAMYDLTERG